MSRNLFDLDNARYLNKKELVETFIPTHAFSRILSPKNQIIIGSRGSGKTALLKMISHDHLALFDNEQAKEIIESKIYIGIHISTKTKFIGGLKNKDWNDEQSKEKNFRWLMNIASCVALLETIKSCLKTYYPDLLERRNKEIEVISKIKEHWFDKEDTLFTLADVAEKLEDIVTMKSKRMLREKIYGSKEQDDPPVGLTFDLELFEPLITAINIVNRKMDFPEESSWFICIDEIEILEEFHHKILNSYMRANMGNIFFKFTTLPYCHYTLETNTNVPLDIRHDVHYVYIDQDLSFKFRETPGDYSAQLLFKARATISKPQYAGFTFQQLFGSSALLDSQVINYEKIKEFKNPILTEGQLQALIDSDFVLKLFDKYSNPRTRSKGRELLKNKRVMRFGDEIGRKMKGLLILKDYEQSIKGNQRVTIYSGAKTVVNVGDANPRKLLGIYNSMLNKIESSPQKQKKFHRDYKSDPIISFSDQNFVLASIAERELNRYRIEKNFGVSLYTFIIGLGEYMHEQIHNTLINTEQISSIEYSSSGDENTWRIIERAVQKGLIYPNINIHNPDEMPYHEGTFHLAFIFAPKFKLLPRKGDSKNILNIIKSKQLTINFDA
ncbi:MAG: hypothetical protein M3Q58_03265 [Bacteroidota bacterium]|nr:hypothetical protein [Bacteroidota bacterium]